MKTKFVMISLMLTTLLMSIGALSAQSEVVGFISVAQSGLEVKREGTEDWVAVKVESLIGAGDQIRTSTGRADITLFDGSATIQLHPDTELIINRMERTEQGFLVVIGLLRGRTHYTLLPVPDTYIGYELTTPTSSVVTAGGIFELWVDENQNTNVLVNDGVVYAGQNRTELTKNNGIRASNDGVLSPVTRAESTAQLLASIDGVDARFTTDADIQLNVRRGPNTRTELLGTLDPSSITHVMGISADGTWYRIRYQNGYGWVSDRGLKAEVVRANLTAYPADYIEVVTQPQEVAKASTTPKTNTASNTITQIFSLEELDVIARLNEWRIAQGGSPMKPNTTLRDLAYAQGKYLLTLVRLPDDLHIDAKGRNPRQRAVSDEFKWPHYASPERVAIGENIYIGKNSAAAINYWQNSQIHRDAALSATYREVGVAVLPHPLGSIYVVVFGARPNVFPVLYDPQTSQVYISSESYRFAAPGDWVTQISGWQMIGSVLEEIKDSGWQPVARTAAMPNMENFVVVYQGDAGKRVITQFSMAEDIAWLPSNLPSADATPETAQPLLAVPVIQQTPTVPQPQNNIFMTATPKP